MTTDDAIAEVIATGFLINNLFQCNTAQWQANLRSPAGHTNFAVGASPAEALEGCLLLLNDLHPPIEGTAGYSLETRPNILSLIAPRAPINRRF